MTTKPRPAARKTAGVPPRKARPRGLKDALGKLRDSENKLSLLGKETGQLIYDYDLRTGQIRRSGAVEEVTGFPPDKFKADIKAWARLIHPDDRRTTLRLLEEAKRTGSRFVGEYRFRAKDGSYRQIRDTGVFLPNSRGKIARMLGTMVDVSEKKKDEKVKAAVYEISEITHRTQSLNDLYRSIHQIIGDLMPARNFYIALYDSEAELLSFPYFMDEYDEPPPPGRLAKGMTEYVLRTGKPLLADPEKSEELEKLGEVDLIGAPSIDWLGVPLAVRGKTIGVMVVQTYTAGVRYTEEAKDILLYVSRQAALAIERLRAQENLREAERFLSNVFASIQDGIAILDADYTIVRTNPTMEAWYRHAMPLKGRKCYEAIQNQTGRCEVCPAFRTMGDGTPACEVVPRTGVGGKVTGWLDLFTFPLIDTASEKRTGVIAYFRDITQRKTAEEALKRSLREKETLLKEIHHRVKNNMQVISSLLNLQSRHLKDPTAIGMFKESQDRIRAMALVHEKLYQSKDLSRIDFSQYLPNLVMYLLSSYRLPSDGIDLRTDSDKVFLDIHTAIPCGLIINELVSNALKYAFPDGRKGTITVSLRPQADHRFTLTVSDTGVGMSEAVDIRTAETLGLQLVAMLVDQLDGRVEIRRKGGTSFRITFEEVRYKERI